MEKTIAVIGGDKRHRYLYGFFKDNGYKTYAFGIDGEKDSFDDIKSVINNSDIIVLPVPVTRDGINLNAYKIISLDNVFCNRKRLYLGGAISNKTSEKYCDFSLTDYAVDEHFAYKNAVLTCEGAIARAIEKTNFAIFKSNVLICGFGRIGKILCKYLKAMGADLTVSARKNQDSALISALGMKTANTNNIADLSEFDLIFNTVPELVFNKQKLKTVKRDCFIIDLASKPGGVDFNYCILNNIKFDHALSLPGIYSEKTSAKIIFEFTQNFIKEVSI